MALPLLSAAAQLGIRLSQALDEVFLTFSPSLFPNLKSISASPEISQKKETNQNEKQNDIK